MGIDTNRLVANKIDEGLLCPICCDILEEPVMIDICEHAFCRKCIGIWMGGHKTCPECSYAKKGCNYTSSLESIEAHEDECSFNEINSRVTIKVLALANEQPFLRRSTYRYKFDYKVLMTSMTDQNKKAAIKIAKEALHSLGRQDFGQIAAYIKKHLEPQKNKYWQCIVGTDFDCL
ncbi:unnamed protein product, partial [Oppiella nova]